MKGIVDKLRAMQEYVRYFLKARNGNGHGIHSPFVYSLVSEVICSDKSDEDLNLVGKVVQDLTKDRSLVKIIEQGGGSKTFKNNERKIADLVKISSTRPKFGRLLYRLANYYQPAVILELGTSIGISTMYLAMGAKKSTVHTIEANTSLVNVAKLSLEKLQIRNIKFHVSEFDSVLNELLTNIESPEVVFIDGNHTYTSTLNYFNEISKFMKRGLIIIDDIYWSVGMKRAWSEIKEKSDVTIDLYQFGMVIIQEQLTPGHYCVRI